MDGWLGGWTDGRMNDRWKDRRTEMQMDVAVINLKVKNVSFKKRSIYHQLR